jgi:hypothetical protein
VPEAPDKAQRIETAIASVLQAEGALIVGPWTGEVGYELLYWIPFVRWALTRGPVSARPVIVVSRGGVASWYAGLGIDRYVDAFEVMSPDELTALAGTAKPKQSVTAGDPGGDEVLARVKSVCGLSEASRLLPHWMYRLYRPYWDGDEPIERLAARARWSRIEAPPLDAMGVPWPRDFIAARFYFSRSFPPTERNQHFARTVIDTLARRVPVVLLNHPFAIDDHRDYEPARGQVLSVADVMTPETNLTVQTAVIGRAAAFVGTYGGLSLLPPLCGVPSYAYCSVPFMKASHEAVIRCMIGHANGAPLSVADTSDGVGEAERILAGLRRGESKVDG